MSEHIGRSWTEHPLVDACPCPKEPCGLIDVARIDPTCGQHSLHAGKTIRQSHTAERCPVTAPTSPKPTPEPDHRDATLRDDLTKLADDWDAEDPAHWQSVHRSADSAIRGAKHSIVTSLRALLAAHPAPGEGNEPMDVFQLVAQREAPVSDTRREDVAVAIERAIPAVKVPGFRFRYALDAADAVLAVLPAPPVADEATIRERIAQDIEAVDPVEWALAGQHAGEDAARIARGATR